MTTVLRRVLFAGVPPLVALLGLVASGAAAAAAPAAQGERELCRGCHTPYVETFEASIHGKRGHPRTPASAGDCTSCHGQGVIDHAKKGGGKAGPGMRTFSKKTPSEERSGVCQTCHASNRHLAFWESGMHRKNNVACNDCHALHATPGKGATVALVTPNPNVAPYQTTVRTLEYETCNSCHRVIRNQLLKPSHHPIIEGRITCSDCHNPHGALSRAMVKAESIPQLCTSCHAEKRGPFIWEHPPVEENCLTCHNAHGSNHARLLQEKLTFLCQDCHDAAKHPGTIYSGNQGFRPIPPATAPSNRLIVRGCVNCHFHVHGSNAPAMRGKFFLR
jgi:DmsE family decaheme c-type cytochrome